MTKWYVKGEKGGQVKHATVPLISNESKKERDCENMRINRKRVDLDKNVGVSHGQWSATGWAASA